MPVPKEIYLYRIERTGSTVLIKMLNDIFKNCNVRYTAGGLPHRHQIWLKKTNIATYRDFRDILTSRCYRERKKYKNKKLCYKGKIEIHDIEQPISKEEIEFMSGFINDQANILNKIKESLGDKPIYLKYENWVNNFDYLFDILLEKYGDIEISREEIKDKYNLNNKIIINEIYKPDSHEPFEDGWINGGEIGRWKWMIPADLHEYVTSVFQPHLSNWGYDIELKKQHNNKRPRFSDNDLYGERRVK